MGRLELRLVGTYRITLDGREVDLGYAKVRALLAYLALEPERAHARDELAELLWPGSPEESARKNLRQALTTLRTAIQEDQVVPPHILARRDTIQFNPESDFYTDAGEFSALMALCARHAHPNLDDCPECMERLKRAAGLYQGDLLKNLLIPESLAFEEWLVLGRERLRLQMIDALGHLAAGGERNGDDEAAMQFARRRLVLDPWNEDAYRALMRVLARRGQRTAALAEFERCKRVLDKELGIEPSAETSRLAEQIRGETGRAAVPSSALLPTLPHLPQPLTPLIGREKEVGALLDLLRGDGVRLVTLLGSPGIGKTRLAMHAAGALKSEYGGNVFFVSLAGTSNPALVMQKIAQALGLCEGDCLSPFDLLAATLKDWKAMLVLDTFEQVLEAAPSLLELLQACPRLKILVTGRAPLHLRGEQRFLLHPLALPDPSCLSDIDLLLACPAVRLLVERAQAVMPAFMLNSKNAAAVAGICARLDGVPLAIELAASSIRLMSPQTLLERLSGSSGSALQLLKGGMRDGSAHHQTLRQAFQWSYDLLDGGARALFARLGVFAGSSTLEAADAVCNIGDIQAGSVDGIAALLDNCLLQQDEGSDVEYRFKMLGTLREFALEQLAGRGELEIMRQRHADYFLTFARLAEPELTGADQFTWLERVDKDLDNLRIALDWAMASSPGEALQLAVALFPFWHLRAFLNEGRMYLGQALTLNPAPTALRGRALAAAGLLAQRQGDLGQAGALIAESVRLCRELDDQPVLAYALNNQSIVYMSLGENGRASQLAAESLALCQQLEYPLGVARAEMIIGQVALNEDRLDTARQSLEASLAFWRKNGDLKNAALCLVNLGRVQIAFGRYPEALAMMEESAAISRRLKDRQWELAALWNSAEVHVLQGEFEEASPLLTSCLEQARRLGDRFFEAITLNRAGQVALGQGDFAQAAQLFNASLDLGIRTGSKWVVSDAQASQGYAALLQKDLPAARALLRESLKSFSEQGEQSALALALEWLGWVELEQGRPELAACRLGAAAAWRTANRQPLPPVYRMAHEKALSRLATHAAAWIEGQSLTLEQAALCNLQEP